MLQISKSDIKNQIYINLEYAEKIQGPARAAAIRLTMLLATQLTQEERKQIADTYHFARSLDF